MRDKEIRITKKNYEIIKDLSDKDLGILTKALCEYQFTGKVNEPKDKVLKVYFNMFKEKIDKYQFFRETGKIGGIRSTEARQKVKDSMSLVLEVFNAETIDEAVQMMLKDIKDCTEKKA